MRYLFSPIVNPATSYGNPAAARGGRKGGGGAPRELRQANVLYVHILMYLGSIGELPAHRLGVDICLAPITRPLHAGRDGDVARGQVVPAADHHTGTMMWVGGGGAITACQGSASL